MKRKRGEGGDVSAGNSWRNFRLFEESARTDWVSDSDFRRVRNFVADGKTSTLYSGNTRHSDIHSSDYSLRSSLSGDVRGERSVK